MIVFLHESFSFLMVVSTILDQEQGELSSTFMNGTLGNMDIFHQIYSPNSMNKNIIPTEHSMYGIIVNCISRIWSKPLYVEADIPLTYITNKFMEFICWNC